MSRVFLLGAGASRACGRKPFRMPLSRDFFELLDDVYGENPTAVRMAHLMIYANETRGSYGTPAGPFRPHIEEFMSEIEARCQRGVDGDFAGWMSATRARDELYEGLPLALNRVQAGARCKHYAALANALRSDDVVITFNWDTSLDRALFERGHWHPDDGYGLSFARILDQDWRNPVDTKSSNRLLKLHGSVNWLTNWITYDQNGELSIPVGDSGRIEPLCFVDGSKSYETWDDETRTSRWPFAFPYYPRSPLSGMPTMSLIIPPVQQKNFHEFAEFLAPLWEQADAALREAKEWFIGGYSFPPTDTHVNSLIRETYQADKDIWIIDPFRKGKDLARVFSEIVGEAVTVHAPRMGFAKFVEVLAKYQS